jgi:hypothetical protein
MKPAARHPAALLFPLSSHRPRRPSHETSETLKDVCAARAANALARSASHRLLAGPALATTLTITPTQTQPPRVMFSEQQTHYVRFTFNFNQCPLRAPIPRARSGWLAALQRVPGVDLKADHHHVQPDHVGDGRARHAGQSTNVMAAFNVFTGQATTAVSTRALPEPASW